MPADSPCIGVDLAPIKPVTKCIALQEDITSQRCRVAIRRHLLDAKVDVVLHDGAPNVGTSWLQDAYGQNELTIFALRLAVDFLQPGGCFVTKAFRSQDYNSLLYVFKQLFAHVEATKPQASRNESAEIFVVCRGFKNAQIDPRFLDPKTVFKDLDVPTPSANVLQQRKGKKAKAEGYEPGAQLLRIERPIVEFVLGAAPVKLLGEAHCFTWGGGPECALWLAHEATTVEVRECCKDLRVLGKGEFRKLLAWRLKMADAWSAAESARRVNEQAGESGVEGGGIRDGLDERECDSEASAAEENTSTLQRLQRQRLKGTKRRRAEQAAKFKERLALKMEHPGDRLDASEEQVCAMHACAPPRLAVPAAHAMSATRTPPDTPRLCRPSHVLRVPCFRRYPQELFSLSRIRSAGALAVVSEDAQPDETAEEVVSPAQHAAGSLTTVNEGALDAVSTVDHLDEQLEAMYAEYKQRVGKRALARLAAEENKGGGGAISKSAKRKARVALETEDGANPEELARRLAAAEMAGSLRAVAYDGEAESDVIESDDEGTVGTGHGGDARLRRNPLLARLVPKPERDDVRRETRQEEERWFGEARRKNCLTNPCLRALAPTRAPPTRTRARALARSLSSPPSETRTTLASRTLARRQVCRALEPRTPQTSSTPRLPLPRPNPSEARSVRRSHRRPTVPERRLLLVKKRLARGLCVTRTTGRTGRRPTRICRRLRASRRRSSGEQRRWRSDSSCSGRRSDAISKTRRTTDTRSTTTACLRSRLPREHAAMRSRRRPPPPGSSIVVP